MRSPLCLSFFTLYCLQALFFCYALPRLCAFRNRRFGAALQLRTAQRWARCRNKSRGGLQIHRQAASAKPYIRHAGRGKRFWKRCSGILRYPYRKAQTACPPALWKRKTRIQNHPR